MFGDRQGIENFQRPGRAEWTLNRIAFHICKGIDEDDPLRRHDFAINKSAPNFVAVGSSHAVVKDAARTEVQFYYTRRKVLSPHHCFRRSDSACALNTSSRGASNTREITNSPFSDSVKYLFFFSVMI